MVRKPVDIRFAHAGDLTTDQAHALGWLEGSEDLRYQEIAIVEDRVIGSWSYSLTLCRGRFRIDGTSTNVAARFRRRGIARALWLQGLARWKPVRVEASVATDDGRDFLASMVATVAYALPDTLLFVELRNQDRDGWDSLCEYYARKLLQRLGRERLASMSAKAKQLPKPKRPKLEVVSP